MNLSDIRHRSWRNAFFATPGPLSLRDAMILFLKGICMGSADIIPGVSGGTIALITGIYQQLLQAIQSADGTMLRRLARLELIDALSGLHARFLLCLFLGIGTALISMAQVMHHLLAHHPVETWSLFFGLIAASTIIVGKRVGTWGVATSAAFVIGGGGAWIIVNLIPVSTPESLSFIFFSGLVAICAMILPGISGAFILLILGKYAFITATLKNPFIPSNLVIIAVFCLGCLVGLVLFSRLLNFLLQRYHALTLSFLAGLMAGSMWKIWPWKEALQTTTIRGKLHVLQHRNVLPDSPDMQFWFAVGLAAIGFLMVMGLERMAREK